MTGILAKDQHSAPRCYLKCFTTGLRKKPQFHVVDFGIGRQFQMSTQNLLSHHDPQIYAGEDRFRNLTWDGELRRGADAVRHLGN